MKSSIDVLPPEIARRERVMGEFTAAFAQRLPEALRTPVAFCGPASFRQPEIDNCWHPYLVRKGFIFFLIDQAVPMIRSLLSGVRRLILGRFGSYQYFAKTQATMLGITPLSICTPTASGVQTNYCHPDDAKNMAWLVFNEAGKEEEGYGISRFVFLKEYAWVLWYWFLVSFSGIGGRDWMVSSLLTLRWIVGLQWVTLWMLERKVESILQFARYEKVFCVHEMWPWARVIWSVARRKHTATITIQHASIVRNKLWYFPTQAERDAGCALPNTFSVFSHDDVQLLSPFYPATTFTVGCGPRYAHWKTRSPCDDRRADHWPRVVLFVTSIPWWDNDTIFRAAKRLMQDGTDIRVRIRLHPYAVVPRRWRRWLTNNTSHVEDRLERSTATLAEDLATADAVCGMNSTVLEEAAAMGCPILALATDRFWSFHKGIGKTVSVYSFSHTSVLAVMDEYVASGAEVRDAACRALGLLHPVTRLT